MKIQFVLQKKQKKHVNQFWQKVGHSFGDYKNTKNSLTVYVFDKKNAISFFLGDFFFNRLSSD